MNRPLTEAELAVLWAAQAKAEGHKPRLPKTMPVGSALVSRPQREETAKRVRRLAAQGLTTPEIARQLERSPDTIRDIATRYGISVKKGVGFNPNPVPRKKQ